MSRRRDTSGINEDDALEMLRYRSINKACQRWLEENDPTYIKDYHRASISVHWASEKHWRHSQGSEHDHVTSETSHSANSYEGAGTHVSTSGFPYTDFPIDDDTDDDDGEFTCI